MGFNTSGTSTVNISGQVNVASTGVDIEAQTTTGSAATRTDTYTVPAGKYWILKNIQSNRVNAQEIIHQLTISATAYTLQRAIATATELRSMVNDIRLAAGDGISVTFGTAGAGNLTSVIMYEEYTI
jgi:hypothetical protein